MKLFWKHGYEGASLAQLTDAMGINRPSLYATFGNKEALFKRAIERYVTGPGAGVTAAFDLPTARETVVELLRFYAEAPGDPGRPLGCLLVNGAMSCSAEADSVRKEVASYRAASVDALSKRFERAQREGDLTPDANPTSLARYYWAVLNGMAVAASDGATRAQLREVTKLSMLAWPGPKTKAKNIGKPLRTKTAKKHLQI
jgi:AcrR family transcriptional regulator